MKKVVAGVAVLAVLAIGAVAFAHSPGWGGHMGYGYGGHMMEQGYGHMYGGGGPMMGWGGGYDQKFLDETKDLRKELHEKKFEYMEAVRNPETDEKMVTALEKEITELQNKLYEKAPRTARAFGRGPCWQ